MTLPLGSKERLALADFVNQVRERYDGQVLATLLYGSQARGEAAPDSDLDLLVITAVADPFLHDSLRSLGARVSLEHNVLLSVLTISQDDWANMAAQRFSLWQNIHAEGVELTPELASSMG